MLAFTKKAVKNPIFWLRFSAYAIPFAFLLYVLYWNFLPFGYNKTFTINVGSPSDTSGEFRLEPSKYLSERKTAPDGTTYRELNGDATAIFEPKAVLKNATITVSVEGDGVSILPPHIDFDPSTVKWDYSWDFTKKETASQFKGDAFWFDSATYFDGKSRLELPDTADKFESGPFTVYAEWLPKDDKGNGQQIVGHFNWELWQNNDSVFFQVGRMNDKDGPMYSIKYPITPDFFNQKHTALAIYNPSENGYIELYVDGDFAGRTYFNTDMIWDGYNGKENLSFGWTPHNNKRNSYFSGSICSVAFVSKNIFPSQIKSIIKASTVDKNITISLISAKLSQFKQISISVK